MLRPSLHIKLIPLLLFLALPSYVSAKEAYRSVQPVGEWNCPESHPIKGNINLQKGTRIYHLPGGRHYNATKPEKCFASEADAERDGFRRSKR